MFCQSWQHATGSTSDHHHQDRSCTISRADAQTGLPEQLLLKFNTLLGLKCTQSPRTSTREITALDPPSVTSPAPRLLSCSSAHLLARNSERLHSRFTVCPDQSPGGAVPNSRSYAVDHRKGRAASPRSVLQAQAIQQCTAGSQHVDVRTECANTTDAPASTYTLHAQQVSFTHRRTAPCSSAPSLPHARPLRSTNNACGNPSCCTLAGTATLPAARVAELFHTQRLQHLSVSANTSPPSTAHPLTTHSPPSDA
jgi:hypothetical protein